eukprot:1144159-Pelagomonas_calceolata.AAC.4
MLVMVTLDWKSTAASALGDTPCCASPIGVAVSAGGDAAVCECPREGLCTWREVEPEVMRSGGRAAEGGKDAGGEAKGAGAGVGAGAELLRGGCAWLALGADNGGEGRGGRAAAELMGVLS